MSFISIRNCYFTRTVFVLMKQRSVYTIRDYEKIVMFFLGQGIFFFFLDILKNLSLYIKTRSCVSAACSSFAVLVATLPGLIVSICIF